MREIKFRAWDKTEGKIIPIEEVNNWRVGGSVQSQLFELMQYTGLKDKNGTEIFEGDIIKGWSNCTYTVTFVEKRGGYYPFAQGDGCGCCDDEVESDPSECTVIGNHFENPELIKEA